MSSLTFDILVGNSAGKAESYHLQSNTTDPKCNYGYASKLLVDKNIILSVIFKRFLSNRVKTFNYHVLCNIILPEKNHVYSVNK